MHKLISRRALAGMLLADTPPERQDLFTAGEGGYEMYRIPGIAVTKRGVALAYCEARRTTRGDWGEIDLYLRRSEDHGRTWGPRIPIPKPPGPYRKNPMATAQNLGKEGEFTFNNPVAIPDRKTGGVHFVFCLEYMRAFYAHSADDGKTFSPPVEITGAFEAFRNAYPWKVLATGPGHGIQLRNGRLLIPVWLSTGTGGHAHRPSVTATIYSDDHGKTWRAGDIAIPDTEEFALPNETCAVELARGGVLLNARSESKARRRILVTSRDGATGWSKPRFHPDLLEPICMGSMTRLSGPKNRILFCNPDSATRDRKNVTVRLSYDEGQTWPVKRTLEPSWSGYSDLAEAQDRTILCLYERGAEQDGRVRTAALTLARFQERWLTAAPE